MTGYTEDLEGYYQKLWSVILPPKNTSRSGIALPRNAHACIKMLAKHEGIAFHDMLAYLLTLGLNQLFEEKDELQRHQNEKALQKTIKRAWKHLNENKRMPPKPKTTQDVDYYYLDAISACLLIE